MRDFLCLFFFAMAILSACSKSQSVKTLETVTIIENYNNWKWDSVYVAKNKYISLAVVPQAAGRILEYNLGDVPSLWLNPELFGKSFATNEEVKMKDWRNFGGYRLVPLPFDNCAVGIDGKKTKRWPPPVVIGDSPYTAELIADDEGNQVIEVTSGIQELPVPLFDTKSKTFSKPAGINERLQYKRRLHIEKHSSLVYIQHTLINKGDKTVKRGIMTTSQHVSRSKPELEDGENFLAYIPFDEKYKLSDGEQYHINTKPEWRWNYVHKNRMSLDKNNPEHVKKYFNTGTNWTGEVAPGIFELHYDYYLMSGFHIIAAKPWICYVNKTNNTVFAKLFEDYNPKLEYEDGVNVAIYNSGMVTGYLETEVKTPLHTLKPGDSFEYNEIHGAAKVFSTPVLDINIAGVITKKISFNAQTNNLSGQYGVFHEGTAVLQLLGDSGKLVQEITQEEVSPLHPYFFSFFLENNEKVSSVKLLIKDTKNKYHLLDSFNIENENMEQM